MTNPNDSRVVQAARIHVLNKKDPVPGEYVLYWMQQSQRAEANHALEYAVEAANRMGLPVVVVFGITDNYPEANLRHYTFMVEGLRETARSLRKRGIQLAVQKGEPPVIAILAGRRAAMIVCDRGYLRHQRLWRQQVAGAARCRVVQVESDVVVPLAVASQKAEYAARTIRPKIQKHLTEFLVPVKRLKVKHPSLDMEIAGWNLESVGTVLKQLEIDGSVPPVSHLFPGGTAAAKRRFTAFLKKKLPHYDAHGNQPQTDDISGMSPYLHFGQISPLTLALRVMNADPNKIQLRNVRAFLEQLIVRRELAMNFVCYVHDYDSIDCLPDWARKTLSIHAADPRKQRYSMAELDAARTHDPYWNAAMLEMKHTGFMHNYMRMYWGKKILEWSRTPRVAFETTLALNNRYFLDGRDPNSYTGVAWIYGVHDRAWAERTVFGKVRYMAATGLERKCDIQGYIRKVEKLVAQNHRRHSNP